MHAEACAARGSGHGPGVRGGAAAAERDLLHRGLAQAPGRAHCGARSPSRLRTRLSQAHCQHARKTSIASCGIAWRRHCMADVSAALRIIREQRLWMSCMIPRVAAACSWGTGRWSARWTASPRPSGGERAPTRTRRRSSSRPQRRPSPPCTRRDAPAVQSACAVRLRGCAWLTHGKLRRC